MSLTGRNVNKIKLSRRGGAVDPFIVMDVMAAAAEKEAAGNTVIHLEVGQPSTPAPKAALAAAHAALDSDRIGYVAALGMPALRQRIARHYRDAYGIELSPDRVIVTTGSSGGFPLAFLASFDAGDRVALAAPGYPAYRNILAALNLEAVDLPTSAADRFQPTVEALKKAGRLDGLIVASPSNPTGTMVGHAEMKALAGWCSENGVRLISDEIYHGIVYEGDTVSAVEVSDSAIVVNSFSKYFSMTGWRVGWLVVPPDLVRPIERLTQNFFISVPTLSQHAALAAFECRDELDGHVRRYRANRDLLMASLPAVGLERLAPAQGAFYLYADIAHPINSACREVIQSAVIKSFQEERERSKQPGYVCTYDDYDSDYEPTSYSQVVSQMNGTRGYRHHGAHGQRGSHAHEAKSPATSQTESSGEGFGAGIL